MFRFVLAMAVLLQHGLVLLPDAAREVFYNLELGAVAVVAFFALSGFIVAEATHSFYAGRPAAFLLNRILRVVPPYLAALALTILIDAWLYRHGLLHPLVGTLHGSPLQPRIVIAAILEIVPGLPAARISFQDFSFVPFAWTLRMEFAFYLAAFAAGWSMRWTGMRHMVLLAILAASAAFAVFVARGGRGPLQIICVPFFLFGIGVFALEQRRNAAAIVRLVLALACSLVAFGYFHQHGHPILLLQLTLIALLFAVIVVLSRTTSVPDKLRRWDRRLGELSYPLYIGHGAVLTLCGSLVIQRGPVPYALAIGLAIVLAIILHRLVEQPLQNLRTRLRGVAV